MRKVFFAIPASLEPQEVADTFNAYILGMLNALNDNRVLGPYADPVKANTWRFISPYIFVLEVKGSEGAFHCPDLKSYEAADILVDWFQLQNGCTPLAQ